MQGKDSGPQASMGDSSLRSREDVPNPGNALVQVFLELVLPESECADTLPIEEPAHLFVAGTVPFDLGLPEGGVVLGKVTAAGAAVPETAVDEDGEPCGGEEEVRLAGKVRAVGRPSGDAGADEGHLQAHFGSFVALAADGGHVA